MICAVIDGMNPENFTSEDEAVLRDALKRCSEQTIEKAVEFRKTGNPELVGPVVKGFQIALAGFKMLYCPIWLFKLAAMCSGGFNAV